MPEGALAGTLGEELAHEHETGGGFREFQVGDQLGTYRLVEFLGKGGMGQVFTAEDTKLGRRVALKLLPPEMASPERRQRFDREAKAVAALNHPNIVHLYSIEDEEGLSFLTMELVEGSTLGERIPEGGLSLKSFFEIAIPLADAISAAHERGVIHRDIKPGNVMIGDDGRVKILDFGLAKLAKELFHRALRQLGDRGGAHPRYRVAYVPGAGRGQGPRSPTNIFSFGVLLYEMCTGRLPSEGRHRRPFSAISRIRPLRSRT
jgi:serine/threonine protein kinase